MGATDGGFQAAWRRVPLSISTGGIAYRATGSSGCPFGRAFTGRNGTGPGSLDAGVDPDGIYEDRASGAKEDRPGLEACLRALRDGDVLLVWKLDRLGRNLTHLVGTVQDLSDRGVGLRVLAGQGAQIDTTTAGGRLVFGIFAALAEFERELIRERTVAGLRASRARGRKGGRKLAVSKAQVRLAEAAMESRDASVAELCRELGIGRGTLYRYVDAQGRLREHGRRVLGEG